VAQEKVREAWEVGKLIDEHILLHKERANYGQQVIKRLAEDLSTSDRELYYMRQFYLAYPISLPGAKLSWSHYKALLDVQNTEERDEVQAEAVQNNWTRDQLRTEVSRRNAQTHSSKTEPETISAEPGRLNTYRIVKAEAGPLKDQLVLDLGFANYFQPAGLDQFKEGEIVEGAAKLKTSGTRDNTRVLLRQNLVDSVRASDSLTADLYTYKAYVTQVIDGDTFDAVIDLGFKIMTLQKLRLRGLDAPEIVSSEGKEAKAFLEKHFAKTRNEILIRTVKSDKYDRYLADVWTGETYLNQALLDEGLAILMND
jgi:endonuclease YncB( thermonuclease family)